MQKEIEVLKKIGTDLQVFISVQKLQQNIDKEVSQFEEWKNGNNLKDVHLKFNEPKNPVIKDVFGSVTVETNPAWLKLPSVIKDAAEPVNR